MTVWRVVGVLYNFRMALVRHNLRHGFGCVACGLLIAAAGCEPTQRVVRDDWATWTDAMKASGAQVDVGGSSRGESGSGDPMSAVLESRRQAGFAVRLAAYDGNNRGAEAAQAAMWARVQGIPRVWTVEADGLISVYAGRYSRADDPSAERLVGQVRTMERGDDNRPFEKARVLQLAGVDALAGDDPYDLRTYSRQYEYSVQIGFFDVQYDGDRRAAAEAWVQELRNEQGQRAFYYHGPHRSMVTIGLFTRRDFVRRGYTEVPGPEIEALREKYPHNLGNGMTLRQKDKAGNDLGEQKSFVVRIP